MADGTVTWVLIITVTLQWPVRSQAHNRMKTIILDWIIFVLPCRVQQPVNVGCSSERTLTTVNVGFTQIKYQTHNSNNMQEVNQDINEREHSHAKPNTTNEIMPFTKISN